MAFFTNKPKFPYWTFESSVCGLPQALWRQFALDSREGHVFERGGPREVPGCEAEVAL